MEPDLAGFLHLGHIWDDEEDKVVAHLSTIISKPFSPNPQLQSPLGTLVFCFFFNIPQMRSDSVLWVWKYFGRALGQEAVSVSVLLMVQQYDIELVV